METITARPCCSTPPNTPFSFGDQFVAQTNLAVEPKSVDRYVKAQIRYKVHRLAIKFHQSREDQEDLRQDFYLALIKSISSYNPDRGTWKTYLSAVLDNLYRHQVRHRMAVESHPVMKPMSLTDLKQSGNDFCDRSANIVGDDSLTDLEMNLKAIAPTMPAELQKILLLLKDHSGTETAQILGISPSTVSRAKKLIRQHLAICDFQKIFQNMKRSG